MATWNPLSPGDWAHRLGLAASPLFGDARDGYALLRDGEGGSFVFAVAAHDAIANVAPSWAWSANVPRAAILDNSQNRTFVYRWDHPKPTILRGFPSEKHAISLIEEFEGESLPTGPTVVDRCLDIFRTVRNKMAETGHGPEESFLAFYATLSLASRHGTNSYSDRPEHIAQSLLNTGAVTQDAATSLIKSMRGFDFNEAVELVLQSHVDGHTFHPDLALRHAGGVLFQEAHYELATDPDRTLFMADRTPANRLRRRRWDAVYTPPSLARTLAHCAISLCDTSKHLTILDPACGSGAFLLAASQELGGRSASLIGRDTSEIAALMATISLNSNAGKGQSMSIGVADSLQLVSWDKPDVIVMNPPFTSWEDMDDSGRAIVRGILGEDYHFRADKSLAFIARAMDELKDGAILATIAPASFMTSQSAEKLRNRLSVGTDFKTELVLHLTGYGAFHDAVVDPVCLVLRRTRSSQHRAVVVSADFREAGAALRKVRIFADSGFGNIVARGLPGGRWVFPTVSNTALLRRLSDACPTTVASEFVIHEGVRTGNKPFLTIPAWQLEENEPQWKESGAFRFEAANSTMRLAKIEKSNLVFYPYRPNGEPLFASEEELEESSPWFYRTMLKPNEDLLSKRAKLRPPWWGLTWPRAWQYDREPRLISAVFCQPGSFCIDPIGDFVITQGLYWSERETLGDCSRFAAAAILNSWEFFDLCCCFSRKLRGGQVECYEHHIEAVPFPRFASLPKKVLSALESLGRQAVLGYFPDPQELSAQVSRAYGVEANELAALRDRPADYESEFRRLWRWWIADTQFLSRDDFMQRHPAFVRIISFGGDATEWVKKHRNAKGVSGRRCDMLEAAMSKA